MLHKKHASERKEKKKRGIEDLIQSERMKKIFLCIIFIILETSLC
jgi:hypothetical protein